MTYLPCPVWIPLPDFPGTIVALALNAVRLFRGRRRREVVVERITDLSPGSGFGLESRIAATGASEASLGKIISLSALSTSSGLTPWRLRGRF